MVGLVRFFNRVALMEFFLGGGGGFDCTSPNEEAPAVLPKVSKVETAVGQFSTKIARHDAGTHWSL